MSDFDRGRAADDSIEAVLDPEGHARELAQRRDEERDRFQTKTARLAFLRFLMTHAEGRVWLKELLDMSHAFELRFATTPNGTRDEPGTWVMAGEQRLGWRLWEQLDEADPVLASRLRRSV